NSIISPGGRSGWLGRESGCPARSAADMIRLMPARLIRSDQLYSGVPYAYAAVAPAGGLVFTAGACPIDETGTGTAPGHDVAQARQVMANLRTALAAAGTSLTDVLKSTVYVASADRADLVTVWDVVHEAFGEHDAPSTLLGVVVLGYADQLVEVEVVAMIPD